jgi:hypothetical protein
MYGQAKVLTWHNDNARTGQNLQETILTQANVNSSTFGRLFTLTVDGKVDAQPLYVPGLTLPNMGTHNVLYVATEHDSLYAFDADNGAQLLHASLLETGETTSDDHGCSQVTPEIGITATPAIDLQMGPQGTIFLVAMTKDSTGNYHHRLHALGLTTLTELPNWPIEVQASYPGSGAENTFNPTVHKERPGLLIANGVVYTTWGSHCDAGAYAGWVISYDENTQAKQVLNLIPNGGDGGIWSAGAGPAADANGNLYLLTGNGTFDTTLTGAGFPAHGDYGNSFVKIATAGGLSVKDYFTMTNSVSESNSDTDLGSGGLMLLPPLTNAQGQPVSLVVGAGKDTNLWVVNKSNLGKFNPNMDEIYQPMLGALPGGVWSSPAWFNGSLYYGSVGSNLKAFAFSNGLFGTTPASQSANAFGYPGTTPSISANGTANGIVWAAENTSTAVLHAYKANDLSQELYNSNQAASGRDHFGSGNKYIVPTIANGKVYVGTTNGVGVFGLLSDATSPVLTIGKTHTGVLSQGQTNAQKNIYVMNTGLAATDGTTITVSEMAPAGLSVVSMSGTEWNCSTATCTRSGILNAGVSYPPITVTVSVASNAPALVTNQASVSGGGSATATASDSTIILNVAPSKVGIFRQGFLWILDVDGNRQIDIPPDRIFGWGGITGDIPVYGDWNGSGTTKAGVFRPNFNGQWLLDYDGTGQNPKVYYFGSPGDLPVVGDWTGAGVSRIGVYRNGLWILDVTGKGALDGSVVTFPFGGIAGDLPVVGDWSATGISEPGLFRQGFLWILDTNGNHQIDAGDAVFPFGGISGDVPIGGDWAGTGITQVGLFRQGFLWILDANGNHQIDNGDFIFPFGGFPGDKPLSGKW